MLKAAVTVFLVAVVYSSGDVIDYDTQGEWGGVCNKEESKNQSPVDVISSETSTEVDAKFVELSSGQGLAATNENNLNAIKIKFTETIKYMIPWMENTEGTVAQLHLHWGAQDSDGSENWLDGKQFSAEAHLVTSYGDGSKYAVINRFFKVGAENAQIAKMIASAEAEGENRDIADFDLSALFPSDIKEVITYEGGLTTPECDEVVHWIVVPEPLTISTAQLAKLRVVKLGDGTGDAKTFNWRNKQDLNERTFKHYKMKTSASAATVISPLLALLALIVNVFY
ncbi:carbonic anhydrase 2-like [Bolinopsis microptera]|uniref:carbonic anhydrase 2-like n=1 Tax=Bolinopsis microptera TaxID=2820187 RepID=UPI00307943D6